MTKLYHSNLLVYYYILCLSLLYIVNCIPGDVLHDDLSIRHEFTQSFKRPYYLRDNRTIPFFDTFGGNLKLSCFITGWSNSDLY
jgi:hypothetical protein